MGGVTDTVTWEVLLTAVHFLTQNISSVPQKREPNVLDEPFGTAPGPNYLILELYVRCCTVHSLLIVKGSILIPSSVIS